MKVDGTSAKTIAIHFLDKTQERYTPSVIAKTIIQAKSLLKSGYTHDEIISVIDFIVDKTNTEMYSLGYVNHAINNILDNIKKEEDRLEVDRQRKEAKENLAELVDKGSDDTDSRERNKGKVDRFGTKSRVGEEPYSDLFE